MMYKNSNNQLVVGNIYCSENHGLSNNSKTTVVSIILGIFYLRVWHNNGVKVCLCLKNT